jgi:hypothetical protein
MDEALLRPAADDKLRVGSRSKLTWALDIILQIGQLSGLTRRSAFSVIWSLRPRQTCKCGVDHGSRSIQISFVPSITSPGRSLVAPTPCRIISEDPLL